MRLLRLFRIIKRYFRRHDPLVEVVISRENLMHNVREYQRAYPKLLFAPVLKSNAYGHGLGIVGRILDKEKIAFFVVDSLYEAMCLRREGVKSQIVVIGYVPAENIKSSNIRNTVFTITSIEQLRELGRVIRERVRTHLKVDTGMHRQGIMPDQVQEVIQIIKANKLIELEGVCSHFADADGPDKKFTQSQIEEWEKVVRVFRNSFPDVTCFHLANSAGTFYADQAYCNVARLGIGLYGINPSPFSRLDLKPVLSMQTVISSIRTIPVGESVGYNATYAADRPMRVATVPVGYFEGVDRRLSNRGFFKIGDTFCPIVGRVSMNITSIDVTAVPGLKVGDPVTIISDQSGDKNSVEHMAAITETIPWEILVHIPSHLRRMIR